MISIYLRNETQMTVGYASPLARLEGLNKKKKKKKKK